MNFLLAYWPALVGGMLIGLSVALLLLTSGLRHNPRQARRNRGEQAGARGHEVIALCPRI